MLRDIEIVIYIKALYMYLYMSVYPMLFWPFLHL